MMTSKTCAKASLVNSRHETGGRGAIAGAHVNKTRKCLGWEHKKVLLEAQIRTRGTAVVLPHQLYMLINVTSQ